METERCVGILTHEAPARLAARLHEHAAVLGENATIVVADTSRDAEAQRRNQELCAAQQVGRILYVGEEERARFAEVIARRAPGLARTVHFALGLGVQGARIGANRNALLLHFGNQRFCSTDDDMVPRAGRFSEFSPSVRRASPSEARQVHVFASREAALAEVEPAPSDYLALADAGLERASSFLEEGEDIACALFGHAGDLGMDKPFAYLIQEGSARERLCASFSQLRSRRDAVSTAAGPTLSVPVGLNAGAVLFRCPSALPPFFPFGRNEDGLWGMLLAASNPGARLLRLPYVMLHLPEQSRPPFPAWSDIDLAPRLCDLLSVSISGLRSKAGTDLAAVGRHLLALASDERFPDVLLEAWRKGAGTSVAQLVRLLSRYKHQPPAWADDVCDLIEAFEVEQARTRMELADWPGADSIGLLREGFTSFGNLLLDWPDLVALTLELQAEGVCPGRCMNRA